MTEDNHAGIQLTQCTGLLAVMPYAILAACVVSAVGERTAPDLQMWALFDTNVGAGLPLVPFSLTFHCLVITFYWCPAKRCGNVRPTNL